MLAKISELFGVAPELGVVTARLLGVMLLCPMDDASAGEGDSVVMNWLDAATGGTRGDKLPELER